MAKASVCDICGEDIPEGEVEEAKERGVEEEGLENGLLICKDCA